MIIRIDPHAVIPPYEQVRSQISEMIATGVVPVGTRLPPIRQLARDLGVAEGTIARSYRELERDGWIETRRRHGSFAKRPTPSAGVDSDQTLHEAATAFAVRVAQTGADPDEAVRIIRETLRAMRT
jgi:DNA-binding transcriptional regulator YhcF (GntR family)